MIAKGTKCKRTKLRAQLKDLYNCKKKGGRRNAKSQRLLINGKTDVRKGKKDSAWLEHVISNTPPLHGKASHSS